jgi:hypothetical protein
MKQPLNPPVPSFVPVVPLSIRPGGGGTGREGRGGRTGGTGEEGRGGWVGGLNGLKNWSGKCEGPGEGG